jgi:hypothetical protein
MRVERAHECALLALGAKVGVDLPQRRLDLDPRDAAHRLDREAGRDVHDAALAELLEGLVIPARYEDHVDVADIVQLARPRLAHPDDGEVRARDLVARKEAGADRAA